MIFFKGAILHCPKCGAKIDEKDNFCPKCGARIERNLIKDNTPILTLKPTFVSPVIILSGLVYKTFISFSAGLFIGILLDLFLPNVKFVSQIRHTKIGLFSNFLFYLIAPPILIFIFVIIFSYFFKKYIYKNSEYRFYKTRYEKYD